MKPDYGIDAPGVIRNLVVIGGLLLLVSIAALLGWLPRELVWNVSGKTIGFPLTQSPLFAGLGMLFGAGWMYFGSRYGKLKERDAFLDRVRWTGSERVLDVGCGRGLLLVGAAHRVKDGVAVGIDIWQAEDLSGNRAEVPLENAAIEGVRASAAVSTADMRKLPFRDGSFDLVTSRAAIHNLYDAADRDEAIREIARVLKPGGGALIMDIRHLSQYARGFREHGCPDVKLLDSKIVSALCALVTFGSLRPNTMLVRKEG